MSDLSKLKRTRRAHRVYVNKRIEDTKSILAKPAAALSEEDREILESNLSILKDKLDVFKKLDSTIIDEMGDDDSADLEKEVDETSEFERRIKDTIRKIGSLLGSKHSVVKTEEQIHDSGGSIPIVVRAKLPKIKIAKFAGDPKSWQSFWDSFQAAVHSNTAIHDVDKFNYLKGLLEGPALAAITGLSLTDSNYKVAVDILEERFGNKQLVISSHMEALLQLPAATSVNDIKKIRAIYDRVEANVRGLESIGIAPDTFGSLLVPVMMNKLPEELRLIITRHFKGGVWQFDALMQKFKEEVAARERCNFMGKSQKGGHDSGGEISLPHSAAALLTPVGGSIQCTYCSGGHKPVTCPIVCDVSARKSILRKKGKCYICLKGQHISKNCQSKSKCNLCGYRHHTSICNKSVISPSGKPQVDSVSPVQTQAKRFELGNPPATTLYVDSKNSVLLQTAQAKVSGIDNGISKKVRVILDSCSQRSYVSSQLKDLLNLRVIRSEKLMIKTFGAEEGKIQDCEVVQLCLQGLHNDLSVYVTAYVVPVICAPLQNQAIELAYQSYPHLNGLRLADEPSEIPDLEMDVLIGSDNYWNLVTGEVKRGDMGPVAMNTRLGWVLSGPVNQATVNDIASVNYVNAHTLRTDTQTVTDLNTVVSKFWELESIGIKPGSNNVQEEFSENLTFDGQRYEVKLPWKTSHSALSDNYDLCVRRLESTMKRLKSQPEILEEYDSVIKDQLEKGIVEEIPQEKEPPVGKVHYLPHHAVVRHDKETTKVRVVYDASAPANGVSLNSCLHAGPSLLPNLMDILVRFRLHRVGVIADIEKAFLMISVNSQDRDVLRFLWVDDIAKDNPTIIARRFARVVFGVNASPFLLNATLNHHISKYESVDPEFVSKLLKSLYVDDLTSGGNNVFDAFELYQKAKSRLKDGGFNLRKWKSNSRELMKLINQNEGSSAGPVEVVTEEDATYTDSLFASHKAENENEQKTLGVCWNTNEDTLIMKLSTLSDRAKEFPATKRNVLRITASVFDPLGLISPIVVLSKIMFQELCQNSKDWDEPLTAPLEKQWSEWITDLRNVEEISVPRCYLAGTSGNILSAELHGFSDASTRAYAGAVYIRITTESGTVTRLVASKSRLAPLAKKTIPRLELLGALILARLMKYIGEVLKNSLVIDRQYCWTDSLVTYYWIKGEGKVWRQFVQNRVDEIRSNIPANQWKFCPGTDNPADLPSRGVKATELKETLAWWEGPKWLKLSEDQWPAQKESKIPPAEALEEMKSEPQRKVQTVLNIATSKAVDLSCLIPAENYSSSRKLFRVTAYVLRFIHNVRAKVQNEECRRGCLTTEEMKTSEKLWVEDLQKLLDPMKLKELNRSLGPFEDNEGIVRCRGRLMSANLPYSTRCPALLPPSHVTSLIIKDCHKAVLHNGVKETLAQFRTRFWLVRGRQLVKKEISQCNTCRRVEGLPYPMPLTAQLPQFRVEDEQPFTTVGVDFLGPLYVKESTNAKTVMSKVYVALYTCATTRAVHLELTPSMQANAFLRSLRRFISRRGIPRLIVSDNFRSFVTVSNKLKAQTSDDEVTQFLRNKGIDWKFNLAKAPWWGGFFERLVRSTKRCLKKQLGNARLAYEELMTLLCEVEAVLNSRPLTFVYAEDVEEALTPSHLLIGKRLLTLPSFQVVSEVPSSSRETVTRRVRFQRNLADHFWKRWRKEYLLSLREHHRLVSRKQNAETINIGDVVIVHEENVRRNLWRLGRVEKLIPGRGGVTRGAVVRLGERDKKSTVVERPVGKLYPLEL